MFLRYSKVRLEAQVLNGKSAVSQLAFGSGGNPQPADPDLQNRIESISKKITTLISRKNELDSSISTVTANTLTVHLAVYMKCTKNM